MIRLFTKEDFPEIEAWLWERDIPIIPRSLYSPLGAIVPNVACGFLTRTDTSVALVENVISNPKAENRTQAILDIILFLEKEASRLGYKYLWGITQIDNMKAHARSIGAEIVECEMFAKEI